MDKDDLEASVKFADATTYTANAMILPPSTPAGPMVSPSSAHAKRAVKIGWNV
jgi:hypothetical protein